LLGSRWFIWGQEKNQARENDQSEPWDEGRWSIVWANGKRTFQSTRDEAKNDIKFI
jgi:hypothetical protein